MAKRPPAKDPYAARETQKYGHAIPSREFIMQHLQHQGVPTTLVKLGKLLKLYDENDLELLHRRLRAMERDGQLIRNRRGGYCLLDKLDLVRGRIIGHQDGFGFLVPDDGSEDLFLSPKEMRTVLHGDRVVTRVAGENGRGRREGAVVEVLERNNRRLVGRLLIEDGMSLVIPDNKRIHLDVLIAEEQRFAAKHGQIVMVEILQQPTLHHPPTGRVVEILGEHRAPGMEIDIAIRSYELPQQWSKLAESEIASFTEVVPDDAMQGREDIRALPLVTIDGEDARDFDDAVYCERQGRGWRLLVAIADVSTYVKPGTALDSEAQQRGNSTYFPERVIPMLPEILSNGLCSINPEVDRLCLVCEIHLSPAGKVSNYHFFAGVMRSHARLTYSAVAAMLVNKTKSVRRKYRDLVPHLEDLYALYQVLHKTREKRGAIEFETTETSIVFGQDKKIKRIVPIVRNDAHRLIEECMLVANVAAADFLIDHKMPTLYRIHGAPSATKLTDLRAFLGELGLQLGGGEKPQPKHYAKLLASVQERPDARLIQTVMLRSLAQAVYHFENTGHFGLAYEAYAHFTSPIRRYPDLLVHRAIHHLLQGGKVKTFAYSEDDLRTLGEHCSMTERRSDEANWDVINWLKCEYMQDKVGETFNGIISGVTSFGIFVELDDIYVEGLVHVTALNNDYYHFDAAHHRLIGERTRKIYRLGDKLRVRVARVDLDERKIDFELLIKGNKRHARKKK